jgi:hypothetical protein
MTAPATTSNVVASAMSGMYVDYSIPLGLYNLIQQVITTTEGNPNTPQITSPPARQQWFSQPRPGNDITTEVITVNFKLPLSVSELGWEALRVSCRFEAWYQDRQNNWRQILDDNRVPVTLNLSTSTTASWYTAHFYCYPIVAKAVQFRITRNFDPAVGTLPYCVGMRNTLIRRNIYTRSDGVQGIEPQQDPLGNVLTSYVKDWDAAKAIDDDPHTFWRSAPLPDPRAVCSLYLDVRAPSGDPQLVDALYIDPVYINQNLNLYYSNDDTVSTRKLSPVAAVPTTDENTQWQQGIGRWDISPVDDSSPSIYEFPLAHGPLVNQDAWVGIEWTPDFSPIPSNAVQTVTITGHPTGGTFTLSYGADTTIGMPPDYTATQVQNALTALASIGVGNVVVGGPTGGPYQVTFIGALGAEAIADLAATSSLTGGSTPAVTVATITTGGVGGAPPLDAVLFSVIPAGVEGINATQTVTLLGGPTGGTFTLTYGGHTTTALAYNATFSNVQAALVALSSIGSNNVIVKGDPGGPWAVTFVGTLGARPITSMTAASSLTGGTSPDVLISTSQPGALPISATTGQYVPTIYYDPGGGQFVLKLTDGTTTKTFDCPISPVFTQNQTVRIVAGWAYDPQEVYLTVYAVNGTVLGALNDTTPNLPAQISFDGTIKFTEFRGLFTAHVVKLENWSPGASTFLANPQVYVSPDPVVADPSGNIPSTTLDNAIYAAAWKTQEHGTGGAHTSHFDAKVWTPIWADYIVQKGKLFFPRQLRMKYLKMEFTHLTEEPYPVYDSGIQVSYNTYPISVLSSQTLKGAGGKTSSKAPSMVANELASLGNDVLLTGVGSVNWLNPSTVNKAINSNYGQTVIPARVTTGPGVNTTALPNTTDLDLANQTNTEVSTSWVYKRGPLNARTLAGESINITASATPSQTLTTLANTSGNQVAQSFSPNVTSAANPPNLPFQGADFWVFPGGTMRMPANVMSGLTGATQVVVDRSGTVTSNLRFTTTSVHVYDTRTVVRDAAVAYFAGLREVQPLVTTYIDGQDPPTFNFDLYDPSQWVMTNTKVLDSGPITTAGSTYILINPNFDIDINNWTQVQGTWSWDHSVGHWDLGTAKIIADGTEKVLLSNAMDIVPGVHLEASVWATWTGLTATSGSEALQLQAWFYDSSGNFLSSQAVGLTYTPWPASTPETSGNVWAQIVSSTATSNLFVAPASSASVKLALVVTPSASAGQINFDTVLVATTDAVEATVFKDFLTTSTFNKLTCVFADSGLVRSNAMWAETDLADTNISSTALAYYTSTIPDVVPAGMWGDTVATWGDRVISWGEPHAVVSIQVDPDRIYDNKRVLHFTRAAGAGEAGIKVRQSTNFTANGLARCGAVFYKPNPNNNQVTIRLRRVSDGVYIHTETFDPVVGYWFNYTTEFFEIPDTDDQEYTVELVCSGDASDEFFLNDLWTDVANIRYFCRLGDESQFLHDITPLRYSGLAVVSATQAVTEFSVQASILSPRAFAYSCAFRPNYLK